MGLIRYMMSGDSRRSLKKLNKMADRVEALAPKYEPMTDAELKAQTGVLKERLKKGETLDDILYDAFAVLREASWRVLGMRHFHVQIVGGICLFQGRIAEMKTGEGKTFVATLASYLEALSGKGVHIVTVNDYLARRDAEWMGKVHKFMGLTVGVVVPGMDDNAKRAAYACDITYGTNNEFGFDYLRDNLKNDLKLMVQRELNFAIVDEVDSILIDEARTPLIISGKGEQSSALYEKVDKFVRTLEGGYDDELQELEDASRRRKNRDSGAQKVAAAEALHWDYVVERKEKQVRLTEYGAEKAERYFGVENIADVSNASLNHHIQQALKAHKLFHLNDQYIINNGEIVIVDEFTGRLMIGRRYSDGLHQAIEAKEGVKVREENKTFATITFQNYFRLYRKLSGMTGTAKTEEGEFRTIYALDVIEIPTNKPVRRDDQHDRIFSTVEGKKKAIVREIVERHEKGQPILVGTSSVDKSEEISRLLIRNGVKHSILNAKNHEREAEIVAQAGRLGAVTIATNMAGRGTDILLGGNPEYLAKKRLREEGVEHETIELATSFVELGEDQADVKAVRDRYNELYSAYKAQTDEEKKKVIEAGGLCIIGTERHESRRIDNQLRGRSGRQGDVGVSIFFISLEDDLMVRFGGERMKHIYTMSKMQDDECLESKLLTRLIEYAQKQIEGRNFGIRKNVLQYDDVMNQQRIIMYAERMRVIKGENVHEQVLKYIPGYVEGVVREAVNADEAPEKWSEDDLNAALERYLIPEGTHFVTREKLEKWDLDVALKKISKKTAECYEEKIARIREEMPVVDFARIERDVLLSFVNNNWIDHIDAMDQLRKGIVLRAYGQTDPVIAYKQEGFAMFDEMVERIQERTIRFLLKCSIRAEQRPVQRIFPSRTQGARPAQQAQNAQNAQDHSDHNPPAPPASPAQQEQPAATPAPQNEGAGAESVAPVGGESLPKAVDVDSLHTSGEKGFNPATMKKAKKVGPNDPCPCGSGLKYKKCCGKPY
ncbi:MAG TPA: preprotein translocase subunit SecA [Firmicutes bacterium]|nr:preprotein translocase subunit SecA [Bacillota bacterium]